MKTAITIPLDIPNVEVLDTEITAENQLLIWVESTQEMTECGICKRAIACTFGHGQEIRLRHLSVLGLETYIIIRPKRGQCLRVCMSRRQPRSSTGINSAVPIPKPMTNIWSSN